MYLVALVHLDEHSRLVIPVGGKEHSTLCRDFRVACDERHHGPTGRLNPKRDRREVEEQEVLMVGKSQARLGSAFCSIAWLQH